MTDLIERYVYDVTRRLPERQRRDVGDELRTEIEAMAEDEAAGKRPAKKHIHAALLKMGDPSLLADQYQERQRYIIGPVYYDVYVQLLKTLLLILVPVVLFFTITGRLASVNEHFVMTLLYTVGVAIEVTLHVFFWVTISFIAVERFAGIKPDIGDAWTPEQLPKLPGEQRITKTDAMVGMTWSTIAIWASLMQIPEINRLFAPNIPLFFAPDMWPWWTLALLAISVLSLGAEIMKLIVGGWTKAMVIVITLSNLLAIGYFISLVTFIQPVANPEFTSLIGKLLDRPDAAAGMEVAVKVFVVSVVAISLYEIYIAVRGYIRSKRRTIS